MRVPYPFPLLAMSMLLSATACSQKTQIEQSAPIAAETTAATAPSQNAQDPEIENNVPISAEATTAIVPGKEDDVAKETNTTPATPAAAAAAAAKPDRIYTDGALADPNAKAEDLGMASPGQKITVDTDGDKK